AKTVPFAALTEKLYSLSGRLKNRLHKRGWLIVGEILLAVGLWRSDWRDDIRQWVNMPTAMLTKVQQIGRLSGTDFGGKYLVAEAQSEDALLKKTAELGHALQPLIAQGKLSGIQSPDQLILPTTEQQKLQNRLSELTKLHDGWK
ncbi:MMPL family transporter, partial [Neisseria sp. P0024.S002]